MGCKFSTYNTFMVFKNVLYFSVNEFSPQVLIILDVVAISVGRPSHAKVNSFPEQRKYLGPQLLLGRFPFVRTDWPAHSNRNVNFTFNQN